MPRYINADRFEVITSQRHSEDFIEGMDYILDMIDNAPTEDVVPRSDFDALTKMHREAEQKYFESAVEIIDQAKQEVFKEAIEQIENAMDLVAQYYKDNEDDEGRQLEYQAQHLGLNKARYILLDLKKKHIGE